MKSRIIITIVLFFSVTQIWSQEKNTSRIPLIGEDAPSFTAQSTTGQITFPDDFGSKWKILFSHPADFTPVCSSEILELAQMQNDFDKLGVKIAVISTDTLYKHVSWKESLETLKYKDREPVKINFPLIDDNTWAASKQYGMLHATSSTSKDVRGVFIIDPKNKVRAICFYPMEVGRDMNEVKRTVIALQTTSKEKVATPANWKPGDDVIVPLARISQVTENTYNVSWYMKFVKLADPTLKK